MVFLVSSLCANELKKEAKQSRQVKGSVVLYGQTDLEYIWPSPKSISGSQYREQVRHGQILRLDAGCYLRRHTDE